MSKKEWKRPELIVLVRGKPEENLGTWCKGQSWAGGGWYGTFTRCHTVDSYRKATCVPCVDWANS